MPKNQDINLNKLAFDLAYTAQAVMAMEKLMSACGDRQGQLSEFEFYGLSILLGAVRERIDTAANTLFGK